MAPVNVIESAAYNSYYFSNEIKFHVLIILFILSVLYKYMYIFLQIFTDHVMNSIKQLDLTTILCLLNVPLLEYPYAAPQIYLKKFIYTVYIYIYIYCIYLA